ncbi:unnamed protein product [Phyllotreta striolata]|uniref:Pesticidal crystal protein domain-containing protein n=1 Tax=Phyllotreta striolata TaxID=444603 RepID=A0A9N9TM75_PHYSR|nr:unnamed protein product [Phyllotreta striolata]
MVFSFACYGVPAKGNSVCTSSDSGIFPSTHPDYYFHNIGKTEITCQVIYGTSFSWIGVIAANSFGPGEKGIVPTGGRMYYWTGQKVINHGDVRALVHCAIAGGYYRSWDDGNNVPLKIDINKVGKKLVDFGVGKIPYVGGTIGNLVDFFWPDDQPTVWDQVKDQVRNLIEAKIMDAIQGILGGDIRSFKEKITVLKLSMDDPNSKDTNTHYMHIAEDLIGFEKKFSFTAQHSSNYLNVNYFLLPMYSSVVNMKVLFYQFGIVNQKKLNLSDDNIYEIKSYLKRLIEEETDGAVAYITKIYRTQFDLEYNTCHPDTIFNSLAVVRQYCAINGFEFIDFWRAILADPLTAEKPYNSVISYSTHYARPTPMLAMQLLADDVPVPLQPKLINGRRNRITKIVVQMLRGDKQRIQGLVVWYENGESHLCGLESSETTTIDFQGEYLKSLTVWGRNALDMFEFRFVGGRYTSCGSNYWSSGWVSSFELEHHHIAGIYVTNDAPHLGEQSASLAVSYQLTPTV